MKILLDRGANIEAVIDIDSTTGNNSGLKFFLDKYDSWSALDIATHKNHQEIITFLLKTKQKN